MVLHGKGTLLKRFLKCYRDSSQLYIWVGKSRFTLVSTWNTFYSCIIIIICMSFFIRTNVNILLLFPVYILVTMTYFQVGQLISNISMHQEPNADSWTWALKSHLRNIYPGISYIQLEGDLWAFLCSFSSLIEKTNFYS